MPKTKFQDVVYTIIMATIMACLQYYVYYSDQPGPPGKEIRVNGTNCTGEEMAFRKEGFSLQEYLWYT